MKKAVMLGFAVLTGAAFMIGVFGQPATAKVAKKAAKGSANAAGSVYTGTVSKVSAESKTMTVEGKRGPVTVDAAKPVLKGYGALSDVKQGDKVSVSYGADSTKITKIAAGKATKAKKPAQRSKKPARKAKKKTKKA